MRRQKRWRRKKRVSGTYLIFSERWRDLEGEVTVDNCAFVRGTLFIPQKVEELLKYLVLARGFIFFSIFHYSLGIFTVNFISIFLT